MVDVNSLDNLLDQLRDLPNADTKRILSKLPAVQRTRVIKILKQKPKILNETEEIKETKQNNKIFAAYSPWLANLLAQSLLEDINSHTPSFQNTMPATQILIKSKALIISKQEANNQKTNTLGFFEYILSFFTETGIKK